MRIAGIPLVPLLLGLAGLVPFVWGAATHLSDPLHEWGTFVLGPRFVAPYVGLFYGAVILAFMSGVIWGFATRAEGGEARRFYALSVVPAIWAFLFTGGGAASAAMFLMFGFAGLLGIDLMARRAGLAPDWWMPLRLGLTIVVLFSLLPLTL